MTYLSRPEQSPDSLGRVLVVTVVHHPLDARIYQREVKAITDAGYEVTYAAPWTATGSSPPSDLAIVDLPRAVGRSRLHALRAARRTVREHRYRADVVVVHDPEVAVVLLGMRRPPTIYDVHEDTPATLVDKPWLWRPLRRLGRPVVHALELIVEARMSLMLADESYAARFRKEHPVVPNETLVPESVAPPGSERVVYLGRVSRGRGAQTLLAVADKLPADITLEVIGPADVDVADAFGAANEQGRLVWRGFMPNDEALARLGGALAGLSLRHDLPNYRSSRSTKVYEYMAHGIPVVTTPVPAETRIVNEHECGIIVDFDDAASVVAALARLKADAGMRESLGRAGHRAARTHYDWRRGRQTLLAAIEAAAR